MAAADVEQAPDWETPLDQVEKPLSRAATAGLLVEVSLIVGLCITSAHYLRGREFSGLDGATPTADVQVAVNPDLVARWGKLSRNGPFLEPCIAKFDGVAT